MATLTVSNINHTGLAPSFTAAAGGGDQFANDGRIFIYVKNAHTSGQTVTVNSQSNCSFGFDHDVAVSVPATNGERLIGPFPTSRFNDSSGNVQITYSGVTSLTIAAIRLIANP